MIDMNRLRELTAELGFMPATIDAADIERDRHHNNNADYWLARRHRFAHLRREHDGRACVQVGSTCFYGAGAFGVRSQADTGDAAANTTAAAYGWPRAHLGQGRGPQSGCPS